MSFHIHIPQRIRKIVPPKSKSFLDSITEIKYDEEDEVRIEENHIPISKIHLPFDLYIIK